METHVHLHHRYAQKHVCTHIQMSYENKKMLNIVYLLLHVLIQI